MNIFALDTDPTRAAHDQCDKHVVRMATESCQLLASVYWSGLGVRTKKDLLAIPGASDMVNERFQHFPRKPVEGKYDGTNLADIDVEPYWPNHFNHPCAVWARTSQANFNWLLQHAESLCDAYSERYRKTHACAAVVDWYKENPAVIAEQEQTPFKQCVPEEYYSDDAVATYRAVYIDVKGRFAEWRYSPKPHWWPDQS